MREMVACNVKTIGKAYQRVLPAPRSDDDYSVKDQRLALIFEGLIGYLAVESFPAGFHKLISEG